MNDVIVLRLRLSMRRVRKVEKSVVKKKRKQKKKLEKEKKNKKKRKEKRKLYMLYIVFNNPCRSPIVIFNACLEACFQF